MTKSVFGLAQDTISHDTVEALQTLLDKAKRGDIIGIAYSVMNKRRSYHVDSAGELHRNPTFAIGTMVVLIYRLIKKAVQ